MLFMINSKRKLFLLFISLLLPVLLFSDADSDYKEGRQLFADKKYEKVLSVTRYFTEKYPGDSRSDSVEYMNAVSLYNLRDYNGALMILNRYESRYPASGYVKRIHYWSGLCWYSVQKYSNALSEFTKQLEYRGESYYYQRSSLYAGFSLEKLNDYKGASRYYLLTVENGNDSRIVLQALFRSGIAFYKTGDSNKALKQFQTLEIDYYDSPYLEESVFHKGEAYFLSRQWEQAADQYELYLLSMGKPDLVRQSYYRLAQIFMLRNEPERAVEFLTRHYEEFPDSENKKQVLTYLAEQLMILEEGEQSRAYYIILSQLADDEMEKQEINYKIAQSFLFEGENKIRALEYYDQVIQGPDTRMKENALFFGGKIRFENFNQKEAVPYLVELVLDYPESVYREEAGYYLVQYYMYTENEKILTRLLNGLQKEYPENTHYDLYEYLIGEIAYNNNNFDKALAHWTPILNKKMDSVLERKLKYYTGKIYYDREEWNKSYPLLDKVASYGRRDDFFADTLFKLTELELKRDNMTAALSWLDQLIKDFPSTPVAGKAYFRKGQVDFVNAAYKEAFNNYKSAEALLESESDIIDASMGQAFSLKADEKKQESADLFLQINDKYPESSRADEALFEHILLLKDMENYSEAGEKINRIFERNISEDMEEKLLSVRAEIYFKNNNEKEGYNTLYQLSMKYPESESGSELVFRQGESFLAKKDYEKASVWFYRCFEMFPAMAIAPDALYESSKALADNSEWKSALEHIKLIADNYPDSSVSIQAGRLASELLAKAFEGNYPGLQEYYESLTRSDFPAVAKAPLHFEYMVLSDYHPRTRDAVEACLDDSSLPAGIRNEARFYMALSYKAEAKAVMAHQTFKETYESEKSKIACRALFEDANLYLAEENLSEALALFLMLEQEYPEYRDYASLSLKKVYDIYSGQGETDRAVIIRSDIMDKYPGSEAAAELSMDTTDSE